MQGPMLKVAPPQCLIIESFIYISCCRKYIRMTNGLRPLAELCMDVCYADLAAVCCTLHHSLVLTICDFGYDAWQAEISN